MKKSAVKPIVRTLGVLICAALTLFNLTPEMRALSALPNKLYVGSETAVLEGLKGLFKVEYEGVAAVDSSMDETLGTVGANVTVSLAGIPLKTVTLASRNTVVLVPGGQAIGIRMHTEVLVVGFGTVYTDAGAVSPAQDAGVLPGDIIVSINGSPVEDAGALSALCAQAELDIAIKREDKVMDCRVAPALDADGEYRLGLWVRDSTLGIGTLSYYDPLNGSYGALGHAITDVDTGSELTVTEGAVSASKVVGVTKGAQGQPGELHGLITPNATCVKGNIRVNNECGVFGQLDEYPASLTYPNGLPIAYRDEVCLGEALLLTTTDETGVQEYACNVIRLISQQSVRQKGLVVEITDPALLERTGGIVQGMSGSPIIQNGKLIGAITHVLLNDPTKGYGINIEDMLDASETAHNSDSH